MSEDGSYIPMQVEGQHNAAQVPQVILSETILPPVIPKVENPFVPEFSPTVSYTPIQITRWGDADAGEIVTTRLPETNAANLRSALNDLCVSHIAIFGPLIEKKGISYILAHGPKLMAKDHTMRDMAGTIIQVAADHRRSPELRLGSLKSFVSDLDKLGQRHIPMDDADLRAQGIDRRSIEQKILSTEDTQARLLQKVLEQMGSGSGKRSRMVPTRSQTDKDMLQLRDKLVSPETRPSVSHWITFAGKPPEDWMVLTNVYNKLDFDGHQLHEEGGLYVPPLHFGLGQYATLSFAIDPTSPDEYLKLPGIVIESLPTASDSMPLLELSQLFLEDETGDVVDLRPFVRINGLGQYVLDAKHLSSGMKERLMAHNVTAIFDKHCIGPIHPPVQQSAEWSPFQDAEKLLCERAVERVHDPDKAIQWLGSEISHTYLYSKSATTPQPGDTTGASSIDRFFLRGGGSCYEANLALCKLISAGKLGDAYVLAGKPGKEATDGVYFIESSQDGHAMTLTRPKGGSWQVLDATPVFKSYEEMAEAQSDVATQDQINALAKTRDTLLEQINSRMGTTHYSDEPLDTLNSLDNPYGEGQRGANFTHLYTSGFTTGAEFTRPPNHKTISGRILENAALLRTLISTVQNALGVQPVSISEPLLAHFGLQNTDLNPNILEHLTGVNRIRERDLVIASTLNPVDRLWVPPMPKLNSLKRWRELVDTPTGYLNTADENISALVSTLKDVAQPTVLAELRKDIESCGERSLRKINHVLQGHGLPPLLERTDLPFIAPVLNASLDEIVELLRNVDATKSFSVGSYVFDILMPIHNHMFAIEPATSNFLYSKSRERTWSSLKIWREIEQPGLTLATSATSKNRAPSAIDPQEFYAYLESFYQSEPGRQIAESYGRIEEFSHYDLKSEITPNAKKFLDQEITMLKERMRSANPPLRIDEIQRKLDQIEETIDPYRDVFRQQLIRELGLSEIYPPTEGYFTARRKSGEYILIDIRGKVVEGIRTASSLHPVSDKMTFANLDGDKSIIFDISPMRSRITDRIVEISQNTLLQKNRVGYYFSHPDGTRLIDTVYSYAEGFSSGLAFVQTSDGSRYIDMTGKEVHIGDFDEISSFSPEGIAKVKRKGLDQYEYINTKGERLFGTTFEKGSNFFEGFATQTRFDGRYVLIDAREEAYPLGPFDAVGMMHNGFANVRIQGKSMFVNYFGATWWDGCERVGGFVGTNGKVFNHFKKEVLF